MRTLTKKLLVWRKYRMYISPSSKFALIGLLAPFMIVGMMMIYLEVEHSEFWADVSRENVTTAGAMMGFAEVVLLGAALVGGCFIGSILSFYGVKISRWKSRFGYISLLLNALPLIGIAMMIGSR